MFLAVARCRSLSACVRTQAACARACVRVSVLVRCVAVSYVRGLFRVVGCVVWSLSFRAGVVCACAVVVVVRDFPRPGRGRGRPVRACVRADALPLPPSSPLSPSALFRQAEDMAVEVLKGVMEDKISSSNVEVATVTKERGYHVCTQAELAVILARMEE